MQTVTFVLPLLVWPQGVGGNAHVVRSVFDPLVGSVFTSHLTHLEGINAEWTVRIIEPTSAQRKFIEAGRVEGVHFLEALEIQFSCKYPSAKLARKATKYTGNEVPVRSVWDFCLMDSLKIEMFCIQLAADLAEPGGALPGTGLIKAGNRFSIYKPPYTHMWECYDEMQTRTQSLPSQLMFKECWDYLSHIQGLRWDTGSTPAAKALAAFTYLYDESSWAEGRLAPLVWACAGLEAFYGDGPGERFAQLRQKIPAFLRLADDQHEKDIRHIYSVRSKLMHGNRAMSSSVSGGDAIPDKHFEEESDARIFGKFYLCETLREAVRRNIETPSFKVVSA